MANRLVPVAILLTAWALLIWQIATTGPLWLKLLYALPLGLVYSMFFNLGHELCHRTYFRGRFWNHFWGRLLFSLVFHNFSLFEVVHNHHHHVYTNVKGLNSWSPCSPEEYRAMSPLRRAWERFLRSPAGIGIYYVTRRLFRLKCLPNRGYMGESLKAVQYWDFGLIVLVHAGLIAALWLLNPQQWLVNVLVIEVIALILGMHIVGTVVFLQHTHRDLPWFAEPVVTRNPEEVTTTSPALAPVPVMDFSYHIMHHRKPATPVFELKKKETELYGDRPVKRVSLLDFRHLLDTMRHCQLYDYEGGRWLRFREVEPRPVRPLASRQA